MSVKRGRYLPALRWIIVKYPTRARGVIVSCSIWRWGSPFCPQVPEGQWFCADCRPKEPRRSERRTKPLAEEEEDDDYEKRSEDEEEDSEEEDSDEEEAESESESEEEEEDSKSHVLFLLLRVVEWLDCKTVVFFLSKLAEGHLNDQKLRIAHEALKACIVARETWKPHSLQAFLYGPRSS